MVREGGLKSLSVAVIFLIVFDIAHLPYIINYYMIRFQRALDHHPIISQTETMPIFVYWTPNAEIWKFGPRSQLFGDFFNYQNLRGVSLIDKLSLALCGYPKLR